MKKLTLLIFIAISTTAFSQGLRCLYNNTDITGTTVTVSIAPDSDYETRIILYTTIPLYSTVMLKAGEAIPNSSHPSEGFIPMLLTGPVCKDHIVIYKFWEVDKGDTTQLIMHYTCATAIHEFEAGIVSDAYPNPAVRQVTIDYALATTPKNAKIVVYDMLGKTVKEMAIENKEGKAALNVEDLTAGLYSYTIMVDGKASKAGKLMIDP